MGAGLTESEGREREKKGRVWWQRLGREGGGGQFFLEATMVFVQDLPPFLVGLPKGGGGLRGGGAVLFLHSNNDKTSQFHTRAGKGMSAAAEQRHTNLYCAVPLTHTARRSRASKRDGPQEEEHSARWRGKGGRGHEQSLMTESSFLCR